MLSVRGFRVSGFRGFGYGVSRLGVLVSGFRGFGYGVLQVRGFKYEVSGTWFRDSGFRVRGFVIQDFCMFEVSGFWVGRFQGSGFSRIGVSGRGF